MKSYTENKDCWVPDADRLAQETDDLLRFGARVLAALTIAFAGALLWFALW